MPRYPDAAYVTIAPDWICEVLSPSTAMLLDRVKKLTIYARVHVAHAWLIDPVARTLEVLRLENVRWMLLGTHGGAEVVRAEPFADVDLPLPSLWTEPEDSPVRLPPSQVLIEERRSGR